MTTQPTPQPAGDAVAQKFRKKPVVIEAKQWFKDGDHPAVKMTCDADRFIPWCPTLEGGHVVTPGDWIITGVKGEHYPCKPDIFEMTYEPVETARAIQAGKGDGLFSPLQQAASELLPYLRDGEELWRPENVCFVRRGQQDGYDDDTSSANIEHNIQVRRAIAALEAALSGSQGEGVGDAAKHWHDLYRKECRLRQDDAARYGARIEELEAITPDPAAPDGDGQRTYAQHEHVRTMDALTQPRQSEAVAWGLWHEGDKRFGNFIHMEREQAEIEAVRAAEHGYVIAPIYTAPPTAIPDGMVVVPMEVRDLYDFMVMAFAPFTSQQEQIAISLKKAKAAMRAAAPGSAEGGA